MAEVLAGFTVLERRLAILDECPLLAVAGDVNYWLVRRKGHCIVLDRDGPGKL
jgi:hypothetical protein